MEVDGERNTVEEVDAELVPTGPDNPHGNAFRAVARPLLSERQARRDADSSRSRYWRVVNPSRRNRLGQPVAYKLVPQYSPTLIADPQAHVSGVAGFGKHHLWVTAYHPAERYAAGDYPAFGDVGLEQWGDQDRPLEAADVVLWHTVGTTHIARPEDWPVMPVERVGFTLKPAGFFDRNPALDLPPPRPAHNC
jgi:primary-amine oxidase